MQALNWNDLRIILAVSRGGTLAAAARQLRVDDTTVARRLATAQRAIGGRLYQRTSDGKLQMTASGERAVLHAERVEREIGLLGATVTGQKGSVSGTTRVTSVPLIVNRILLPAASRLVSRHPDLRLELVAEARDLSLTRREADLALRLARPRTGGTRVIARRVGTIDYEVYAPASCTSSDVSTLPWITYDEAMAHLPQARWIAGAARHEGKIAAVRVNDAEGVVEAVAAGLGKSLLPSAIAGRDSRLKRIGARRRSPILSRELWLLMHAESRDLPRIEAVVAWIQEIAASLSRAGRAVRLHRTPQIPGGSP